MSRRAIFRISILLAACAIGQAADSSLNSAEQTAVIQAIREYAVNYTKRLPKFTCVLTTRHVSRPPNAPNNPIVKLTTVEEQVSFLNGKELHEILKVDGEERDSIKGPLSQGEFGNILMNIFGPEKGTALKWIRSATLDGRKVDVVSFHVPQRSGYILTQSKGELQVPFEGSIFADRATHAVLRLQAKCTGIPAAAEYGSVDLTLDYGLAKVAGEEFILPSHYLLNYVNTRVDRQNMNEGRFSGYREFSADTSIRFDDAKQ